MKKRYSDRFCILGDQIAATIPGETAESVSGKQRTMIWKHKNGGKKDRSSLLRTRTWSWILRSSRTRGRDGGDAVTMSWLGETTAAAKDTGYLVGTAIFGVIFVAAVLVQIKAKKFHPFLYWLTIVATTTVGTTLADYCTRSLGIGYTGGSTILLILVIASPGPGAVHREHFGRTVNTRGRIFSWVTIMLSQTWGRTRRLGAGQQHGISGAPRCLVVCSF